MLNFIIEIVWYREKYFSQYQRNHLTMVPHFCNRHPGHSGIGVITRIQDNLEVHREL